MKHFLVGLLAGGVLVGGGILIGLRLVPATVPTTPAPTTHNRLVVLPTVSQPPPSRLPQSPADTARASMDSEGVRPEVTQAIARRFGHVAPLAAGWGKALEPNPEFERTRANAAQMIAQGHLEEAISLLRDAIAHESNPSYAEILRFRLLEVFERADNQTDVLALLEEIGRTTTRQDTQAAILERLEKMAETHQR